MQKYFCMEQKESEIIKLEINILESDDGMQRIFGEYSELFFFFKDLGVLNVPGVVLNRIHLGYILIDDKYINYLQKNCNGLNIGLFIAISNYFRCNCLNGSPLTQLLKLENDETIKTSDEMVNKIMQICKKWLIKCVLRRYEEIFLHELLNETGKCRNSKRFLFWLLFGANGDDILNFQLHGKQLFNYFRAMKPQQHGLDEDDDDGLMGHYVGCRIATWIVYTFVSYFGNCRKDNIDHIKSALMRTKVDFSGGINIGDGINNNNKNQFLGIRTGFDLMKLYQCQSTLWHEKIVLFNTSLIHSSIIHSLWRRVLINTKVENMTQDMMIWFIKYFYEKLCQISSVYYKILQPKAHTTYQTLDNKGSKLRQIANEYKNISLLQFGTNDFGNLLHYAIRKNYFKLINFLIVDCQFDTDLKTEILHTSPFDLVLNDKQLLQKFKENNILIPPTYRKTTANQLYKDWLCHEGKIQRALQVSKSKTFFNVKNDDSEEKETDQCWSLLNRFNTILNNLKTFEAIDQFELCLVYRLLLLSTDKKHNGLARKLVFAYVDALDEYVNGNNKNIFIQNRVKHYLLHSKAFFLFEKVTQILTNDEVSKIKIFMEQRMNEADIGILETVCEDKKQDDGDTKKTVVNGRHKKTNSQKLMALMRLCVYDLTYFTLSQSKSQIQGKEKLFGIKVLCENSPGFDELTRIKYISRYSGDLLRQDTSPYGVQWDYIDKDWNQWYIENKTKPSFDPIDHYDDKHVKDLLSRAHLVNKPFQQQVATIVKHELHGGKYLEAPVKNEARVSEKSQTDYRNKRNPKSAHVLDIVRCSILFDNIQQLTAGINKFIKLVENEQAGGIVKIIRFKNGYSKIPKWKTVEDALYADAKANVLFKMNDKTMICEIQFLFTQCQEAKKIVHKFYTLQRKIGLMTQLKWRQARRENEKSLPVYFSNLIEEHNLELLSLELSTNPSNVKYFKDIWLTKFDRRNTAADEYCENELQLMIYTVWNESQKQADPRSYINDFFNSVSPLKALKLNTKDPKLVCSILCDTCVLKYV